MEPIALPKELKGDRILMRCWPIDRAQDIFGLLEKNHRFFSQYMGWVENERSVSSIKEICESVEKNWNDKKAFSYIIFKKQSDEVMGMCAAHGIEWPQSKVKLGYWLGKQYNGQGYMTEAVQLLEKTLFEHEINRICVECDPLNQKSSAIPKRLGYTLEGILRQNQIHKGEYRDTEVYSKLKNEWKPS